MNLCKHGHDKDVVGVLNKYQCRECDRIRSRQRYKESQLGRQRAEARRLRELDVEAERAKLEADLAAMRERVRLRQAKRLALAATRG